MLLHLTDQQWTEVMTHVDDLVERAAFMFTTETQPDHWAVEDMWLLDGDDYYISTSREVVLNDELRPRVIAHAHAGGYAVVELHSHWWPGTNTRFSPYDINNLLDFAPHMIWRLPGRPYAALVLGINSFDALVWHDRTNVQGLAAIIVDTESMTPTGISLSHVKGTHQ